LGCNIVESAHFDLDNMISWTLLDWILPKF